DRRALEVRRRFADLFWNESAGCLYDVIDGDDKDTSLRPNQLIALALPFPLLDDDRAARVLAAIEEKLLTPFGLRTLSPDDPRYRPVYTGGPWERDSAYHQGTVWPWPLRPGAPPGRRGPAPGERAPRRPPGSPGRSGNRFHLRDLRRRSAPHPPRLHRPGLERC